MLKQAWAVRLGQQSEMKTIPDQQVLRQYDIKRLIEQTEADWDRDAEEVWYNFNNVKVTGPIGKTRVVQPIKVKVNTVQLSSLTSA